MITWGAPARAEDPPEPPPRAAIYEWDSDTRELSVTLRYRDVLNASLWQKLRRGLPTTILFSGAVYTPGREDPVSTTVQSCKVTWHVWEEAYRVDITRPGFHRSAWTTTIDGVLRRCAEARRLLIATHQQLEPGRAIYMQAKVQVNPISPKLLDKIKRWVSRPTATGTAAPGDALFGTFTGLFLQRIGKAEREIQFTTLVAVPRVRPPPKKDKQSGEGKGR